MKTILFLLLMAGTLLVGSHLQAGTWYVKPAASGLGNGSSWANASASLATIITGAASGDQVWVAAGTYIPGGAATSTFTMKTGVSVYGGFAGGESTLGARNWTTNVTTLSGNNVCYNVVTSSGVSATTTLDGFTITKGIASGGTLSGGGIYDNGSTITFANCIITINTAAGSGGGAYVSGGGTVTFTNCTFSANSTTAGLGSGTGGGGLACVGGTSVFTSCTFSNNTSSSGGGGIFNYNSGNVTMTSCTFSGNVASGDGGGIDNQSAATYLTACTLTSNTSNHNASPGGGGAAYTNSGTGIQLTNCVVHGNTAYSFGGGYLDNGGSSLGITYTTFTNNTANYGGGIYTYNGTSPGVQNSYFSNNLAHVAGGGLFTNNAGAGNLVVDTFYNNTADDTAYNTSVVAGGGVCNTNASNVGIIHCIFQGNVATHGDGGGVYELNISYNNDSSDIFIANVANNGNGGGLVDSSGNTKFFKSVFADNQAGRFGGGAYISNNTGTLESCTFSHNKANTGGSTYGDGIYEANGTSFKILGNMIWSSSSTSSGLVGAAVGSKVQYNDIINGTAYNGSNGNIMLAPTFGNSGNYIGADGLWETADDGLHLVNGSNGTDLVIFGDYFNVTDITEAARPDGGGTLADMGAYEGPGTFTVLAVQLMNFTATPAGDHTVSLNWETTTSDGIASWQIERSVNGVDFGTVGIVDATATQTSYQWTDPNANEATIYYRLGILRTDGSKGYSSTVVVRNAQRADLLSLRPTAATQGTRVLYVRLARPTLVDLTLVDVSGRMVWKKTAALGIGDNYWPIDVSDMATGLYYLQVGGAGIRSRVIALEKL